MTLQTIYGDAAKVNFETIKNFVSKNATNQEILQFLELCRIHKLNPFIGDVFLVKYSQTDPAKFVVAEKTWNRKLHDIKNLKKVSDGIIVKNSEGKIDERVGEFYLENETLLGAWCEIVIEGKSPIINKIRLSDYDRGASLWKTIKARMINKICRVQTIRKAIPDMGDFYIKGEMDAANQKEQKKEIQPLVCIDVQKAKEMEALAIKAGIKDKVLSAASIQNFSDLPVIDYERYLKGIKKRLDEKLELQTVKEAKGQLETLEVVHDE